MRFVLLNSELGVREGGHTCPLTRMESEISIHTWQRRPVILINENGGQQRLLLMILKCPSPLKGLQRVKVSGTEL